MTEGPVQINMYGIRYFIDGDLSDPHVKKLMVQARNDLQQMKGRNINNIGHTWLVKPNAYKIVSQFGIDSAYINVPRHRKGGLKEMVIEKKKEKKYFEEYIIAHEVWIMKNPSDIGYANATQVGYLLCEGGGWNPPYKFIEPISKIDDDGTKHRNVIYPFATKAIWEAAKINGVTVFPFFWNGWKGHWALDNDYPVAPWGDLPIGDVSKELIVYDDGECKYSDIPCNLQELVCPYYSLDNIETHNHQREDTGYCFHDYWCYSYEGSCSDIAEGYPDIFLRMTVPGVEWGYEDDPQALNIPGTQHTYHASYDQCEGFYTDLIHCDQPDVGPFYDISYMEDQFHRLSTGDNRCMDIWYHEWDDYDFYRYPATAGWSCAKDLSQHAYYYEYESYYNSTFATEISEISETIDIVQSINWEQGINVDGVKYPLKAVSDDAYEYSVRNSDPCHIEELAESVCLKYFDNPRWVIATIQRYKLSWDMAIALSGEPGENGYPGPEMWCVWINVGSGELHWDQTFPPPIYHPGTISEEEDEWWGGINGNSTIAHFRIIPNSQPYKDSDGAEYPLLTAGQFRLFKRTWEEETPEEITEREITIMPEY